MTHAIQTPQTFTRLGLLFAAVLLCLMTVFGVSSAQAHDELISSTPATGDVLKAAPKSLVLTFSGDIKKIGTILELSDAQGTELDTNFAIDRREVTVTPASTLGNGSYTLVARVVSSDGHPIDKKITFEVKGPAASSATASAPAANPAAPSPEASAQASTAANDAASPVAGMPAGLVWGIVGVAALGLIAMVLLKVRRQTK